MSYFRICCFGLLLTVFSCTSEDEAIEPDTLDQWTYYSQANGLADNFVINIYEDKSGTLWFSHDGAGVTSFNGVDFEVFNINNGLISNDVTCVLQDRNDNLLVGTRDGLSFRSEGNWYYVNELVGVPIYSMFEDNQGVLWLGTGGYGILYNEGNGFFQLYDSNCSDCNTIYDIDQTKDEKIWFATWGGLKQFSNGNFRLFTVDDGLADNSTYALHEDTWGDLWIGSIEGKSATRFHGSDVEKISLANSNPVSWVTSIQDYSNGELWIGTVGYGLLYYDGTVMRRVFEGSPSEFVSAMLRDSHGNMWVGTNSSGVGKYTPR